MMPISAEREAQLEQFAQSQDPAAVLDQALAAFLELEARDFSEAVATIHNGYADVKAGRTRPAAEFLSDLRRKHRV